MSYVNIYIQMTNDNRLNLLRSISQKLKESTANNDLTQTKDLLSAANRLTQSTVSLSKVSAVSDQNTQIEQLYREEILQLRRQKERLQGKVRCLQQQFSTVIQLREMLGVFACKIKVSIDDYDKVDCLLCEVHLLWDRLTIRSEGHVLQTLSMSDLSEVTYGEEVMLLQFGEIFVFLQVKEGVWDEMLYRGYHYGKMREKRGGRRFARVERDYKLTEEGELVKILIQKRDQYLAVKEVIDERIVKTRGGKKEGGKGGSKEKEGGKVGSKEKEDKQKEEENKAIQRREEEIRVFQRKEEEKRQEERREQEQREEERRRIKAVEEQRQREIIIQEEKKKSKRNACVSLQHGYQFTKYSKDGFYPHEKKVFLSIDQSRLCWADPKKTSEYRHIQVASIREVYYNKIGEGIKKHVQNGNPTLFSVIDFYTLEGKVKSIEFGCNDPIKMKNFTDQLEILIEHKKQANTK